MAGQHLAPLLLLSLLLSSAALSAAAEVGKDQKSGDPAPQNTKAQDAATLDNKSVKPNSGNNSNSSNSISTGSSSSSSSEGIDTTSSSKDNTMPAKPGQIVRPKAPGMNDIGPDGKYRFPLDLKLSVKREGLKAVGTATIINTLKDIVEIPKVYFDIRFTDAATMSHKDDIRQQEVFRMCGSTKLPTTLAPGAKLECPFKSRENIYKGPISVVTYVDEVSEQAEYENTGRHVAFDVVNCPAKDGADCIRS